MPHLQAHYNLGLLCEQGLGTTKDENNAYAHFQEAALQGHEKAREKLRPLLEKHPGAQCLFGRLYSKGVGVAVDEREACLLFYKAYRKA